MTLTVSRKNLTELIGILGQAGKIRDLELKDAAIVIIRLLLRIAIHIMVKQIAIRLLLHNCVQIQ